MEFLGLEVSGYSRKVCEEAARRLGGLMAINKAYHRNAIKYQAMAEELTANNYRLSEKIDELREKLAELSDGEYVDLAFSVYDRRETIENCTVEILTNSKTGEVSVGWTRSKPEEEADSPQIQE